jgi:hypothetical protein
VRGGFVGREQCDGRTAARNKSGECPVRFAELEHRPEFRLELQGRRLKVVAQVFGERHSVPGAKSLQ